MLAGPLARLLAARGIHYGWLMLALTFGFVIASSGVSSIPSVLLVPISNEFGWSIGELSGPLGLRMALFGLVAPFAGALMLRYGPRNVLSGAATLLIVGLILAITMSSKLQLWLSLGIILGVAPGMTALVLATTVATRWFTKHRGLVLGIMSAGTATGQLIFLTPAAWLAEHYGWRTALIPTIVVIAVLALAFALLSRDRPSDLGLPPYGEDAVLPPPRPTAANPFLLSLQTVGMASKHLVFWVLAFTFFVCGVSSFGLVPHFVTMCGDFGITPVVSTGLLTLIGICDLIGTIGSGWLSDRYDNRWLLAFYYGFRGLSLMWLPYSGFSLIGLSGFAIFYGLDFIATVPPTVKLAVRAFGRDQAPIVFGWVFAAHQLGSGVMALAAGHSRDALDSYLPAFFTAGVVCILATASLLLLRGRTGPVTPAGPAAQPA